MAAWVCWGATQHVQQVEGLSVYAAYIFSDDLVFYGPISVFFNSVAPFFLVFIF
jgi:hypothetical protein